MRRAPARRGASSIVMLGVIVASALFVTCTLDQQGTEAGAAGMTSSSAAVGSGGGDGLPTSIAKAWKPSAPPEPGRYMLPPWLALESPTPNKTVQVGESTVVTTIAANVARARRTRADRPWGLSLESQRQNRIPCSTPAQMQWFPLHTVNVASVPGPDGAMSAERVWDDDPVNAAAVFIAVESQTEAASTVSAWVGDVSGLDGGFASIQANAFADDAMSQASIRVAAPAPGWRRVDFTGFEIDGESQISAYPAAAVGSDRSVASFAFFNLETARYPSSAIVTTGEVATREADVLYAPDAAALLGSGRLNAVLEFAPNYASGEQAVDHDLLFLDPENRVFLRASDSAIVLQLKGPEHAVTLTTGSLVWAREQDFRVEVTNSPVGQSIYVAINGGQDVSVSDPTDLGDIALPDPPRLHILGGPAGSQECADLHLIVFYKR
jgi:hypothetical protein